MAKQTPTQRDMITGLYTELLGIDGHGGMRQDVKEIRENGKAGRSRLHAKIEEVEEHVDDIKDNMVTDAVCEKRREANGNAKKEKSKTFWDRWPKIVGVILIILGWGISLLLLYLRGK